MKAAFGYGCNFLSAQNRASETITQIGGGLPNLVPAGELTGLSATFV
jgi:hypothetical protein